MSTTTQIAAEDLQQLFENFDLEYDPVETDFDACAEAIDEFEIAVPGELVAVVKYCKRQEPPIKSQTWIGACRKLRKLHDQLHQIQEQLAEFS